MKKWWFYHVDFYDVLFALRKEKKIFDNIVLGHTRSYFKFSEKGVGGVSDWRVKFNKLHRNSSKILNCLQTK